MDEPEKDEVLEAIEKEVAALRAELGSAEASGAPAGRLLRLEAGLRHAETARSSWLWVLAHKRAGRVP